MRDRWFPDSMCDVPGDMYDIWGKSHRHRRLSAEPALHLTGSSSPTWSSSCSILPARPAHWRSGAS